MTIFSGVCTISNGIGMLVMRGTPGNRHAAVGSSTAVNVFCLAAYAAVYCGGSRLGGGAAPREPAGGPAVPWSPYKLTPPLCQTPEMSGAPAAERRSAVCCADPTSRVAMTNPAVH